MGFGPVRVIGGGGGGLGFTPEDVANKDTDVTLSANSDTFYPSQRAVKTFVDSAIGAAVTGTDVKDSVVTCAKTPITLSGEQTIAGRLTSSDRVGVIAQAASEDNGIYVSSAGAWVRSTDADTDAEVNNGLTFFVSGGGSNLAGNAYLLITDDPITLGVTGLDFIEIVRIGLGTTSGTATPNSFA